MNDIVETPSASARRARSATPGPIPLGPPAQSNREQCRSSFIPAFYPTARSSHRPASVPLRRGWIAGGDLLQETGGVGRGCEHHVVTARDVDHVDAVRLHPSP